MLAIDQYVRPEGEGVGEKANKNEVGPKFIHQKGGGGVIGVAVDAWTPKNNRCGRQTPKYFLPWTRTPPEKEALDADAIKFIPGR